MGKQSAGKEITLRDIHAGADFKFTPTKYNPDYFSSEKAKKLIDVKKIVGS